MKLISCLLLVLALFRVGIVNATCVNTGNSSSICSLQLPAPFNMNASVNITFHQGLLNFQQMFGLLPVNTFSFQAPSPAPQGATCISNEQISWCLLFVNYANNGKTASADIVSTFVEKQQVWTGDQGSFFTTSTSDVSVIAPVQDTAPPVCGKCLPGCFCNPGRGCFCCPINNAMDACAQLAGVGDIKYVQATITFQDIVWFVSSSYVQNPQPICTVSNEMVGLTVCLDLVGLTFIPPGIQGSVVIVYFKGTNIHQGSTLYLGNFIMV